MERAVSTITTLNNPEFTSSLRKEVSDLLLENRQPGTSAIGMLLGMVEDFEILTCAPTPASNHQGFYLKVS